MKKREQILGIIVFVLVVLALAAAPAAAAGALDDGQVPTFDDWLRNASGPLISAIAGVVLSFAVEWWPAFNSWPSKTKRAVYLGLCLIIPVGAACLRAALGYVEWSFDPLIWHAIWSGAIAGWTGTLAHIRKLGSQIISL